MLRKYEFFSRVFLIFLKNVFCYLKGQFMFKTTLAKIIVSCLVYGLASGITQRIWR